MEFDKMFTAYTLTEKDREICEEIRKTAKAFSELINKKCPSSRERSLAFTKIEEAVMWANASIGRNK